MQLCDALALRPGRVLGKNDWSTSRCGTDSMRSLAPGGRRTWRSSESSAPRSVPPSTACCRVSSTPHPGRLCQPDHWVGGAQLLGMDLLPARAGSRPSSDWAFRGGHHWLAKRDGACATAVTPLVRAPL